MNDLIDLGVTTPTDEDCAQVGSRDYDYHARARIEARALIDQLRRALGPEPAGARFAIRSHEHDFGTYLTVVCRYDPSELASRDYAFGAEAALPETWDASARQFLAAAGYSTGRSP